MEQSAERIDLIFFGFICLLVVSSLIGSRLKRRALNREGQIAPEGARVPSIEERVAGNAGWSRGEIRSKGRIFVAVCWLLAIVWNLTFGASFFKSLSNPDMKTGGLVVLGIFAALGLAPIAFAVRITMRQLRFGESLCRIPAKAGVLGKTITGSIRTKSEVRATGDYTVELQCVETYTLGSGKDSRTKTEIHWQGKQTVPRAGVSSRAGVPFSFELPDYPPETGHRISRGQINWQLSIHAPVEGVDYAALFVVPVFKLD